MMALFTPLFFQVFTDAVGNIAFGNSPYVKGSVGRRKSKLLPVKLYAIRAAQWQCCLDIIVCRYLGIFCGKIPQRGKRRNGNIKSTSGFPGKGKSFIQKICKLGKSSRFPSVNQDLYLSYKENCRIPGPGLLCGSVCTVHCLHWYG